MKNTPPKAPLCECGCPQGRHVGQRLHCVQCRMCKRYVPSKRNAAQADKGEVRA